MPCAPLAFLGFGFFELLVVGVVALVIYGGELPNAMRTLGRSYARFRQGLMEMSRPVREELQRVTQLPEPPPTRYGEPPEVAPPPPAGAAGRPSAIRTVDGPGSGPADATPDAGAADRPAASPGTRAPPLRSTKPPGLADEPPPV